MIKIVFASHVALIKGKEYDGIGNVLKATLNNLVDGYVFVRNSIDGNMPSEVQHYKNNQVEKKNNLKVASGLGPLRYVSEYFNTVKYFSDRQEHIGVYIGIDPLNALSAIRLKKKGIVGKVIFYTADYSPKRFNNHILNRIYHYIDKYCVKNSDEVWSVSTRICGIRRRMGLEESKNIFVPNVPPIEYTDLAKNPHDRYELITTGIIDKQLDFEGPMKAVSELKDDLPKLKLTIVGNGPEEARLQEVARDLNIADRVEFTGRLPLEEALERQSRAGIGLALYTGVWGFNEYGDSTKCREYFNFGLPVISTDTHSTVEDIKQYNAGVIVEKNVESYKSAILDICEHYDKFNTASYHAGKAYAGVHKNNLQRLIEDLP